MLSPLLTSQTLIPANDRASVRHVKRHLMYRLRPASTGLNQLTRDTVPHGQTTLRYRFYGHPCGAQPPDDLRKSRVQRQESTSLFVTCTTHPYGQTVTYLCNMGQAS